MHADANITNIKLHASELFCTQVTAENFLGSQLACNRCSQMTADGTQIFLCPVRGDVELVIEQGVSDRVEVFIDGTRMIWAGLKGTYINREHSRYMRE